MIVHHFSGLDVSQLTCPACGKVLMSSQRPTFVAKAAWPPSSRGRDCAKRKTSCHPFHTPHWTTQPLIPRACAANCSVSA
jgi:hypothetical protein